MNRTKSANLIQKRFFPHLLLFEDKIRQAFPIGMQQGTSLKIEYQISFENGCYESWCYMWKITAIPFDINNGCAQSGMEIRATGKILEPEIDAVLKMKMILDDFRHSLGEEEYHRRLNEFFTTTFPRSSRFLYANEYDTKKIIECLS